MKVIQIMGPSYCGSTVLGYALNTVEGFFFGSEVKRCLSVFNPSSRLPKCDYCGENCSYWSRSFLEEVSNYETLDELYKAFSSKYPDVQFFVDGSKQLNKYKNTSPSSVIVCVKHPLRMLASYLYNSKNVPFLNEKSYSEFREQVSRNESEAFSLVIGYLDKLKKNYQNLFKYNSEYFYFKSDEAHLNNMSKFNELMAYIGCPEKSIDPLNFSKYPCHSIGGNRAPVQMMKENQGLKSLNVEKFGDRFSFYRRAEGFGDWKIDDKYKELLPLEFVERVKETQEYRQCLDQLGYVDL